MNARRRLTVVLTASLLWSIGTSSGRAFPPTITAMPESSLALEEGRPIIGDVVAESGDPVDVFNAETVGFWGFSNGGSVENIPLEPGVRRTFLVARWKIEFDEPTPIYTVVAGTWGHQDGLAQMRLLDENQEVIRSKGLVGTNTFGTQKLHLRPTMGESTYYLDLFDYSRDIRYINGISLATVGRLLPGDVDLNGVVGLEDFAILKQNFGGRGAYAEGDVSGDGIIDLTDFQILRSAFGETSIGVPEPCSLTLALVGTMLWRGLPFARKRSPAAP